MSKLERYYLNDRINESIENFNEFTINLSNIAILKLNLVINKDSNFCKNYLFNITARPI